MKKIRFAIAFLFGTLITAPLVLHAQISGPATATPGSRCTYTMTYTTTTGVFSVSGGTIYSSNYTSGACSSGGGGGTEVVTQQLSAQPQTLPGGGGGGGGSYCYSVTVTWGTGSSGSVTFVAGGVTQSSKSVLLCSATPPVPNATFTISNCGTVSITYTGTPPANTTWYWQTSSTGTSGSNSTSTYTSSTAGTFYLRAYSACFATWSTAEPVNSNGGSVPLNPVPSAPSGVSATAACGSSGSTTITGTPGANGDQLGFYTTSTGTTSSYTGTSWPTTANTAATFYVSTYNSITGCESTVASRVAVTPTINTVPSPVTSYTNGSRCGTGTVSLSAAYGTNGTTVNWYNASTGGSPLPTSPALNYTTSSISSTTTYYVTSLNASTGCESTAARTAVTATVNAVPSAVASVTNGSRCGTGTVSLSAAYGTNGTTVNWYNASTGGSPLPTSPALNYTTPSISSTTTYYVTSLNASTGCESTAARTAVTATVNAVPSAVTSFTPGSVCGTGRMGLSAVAGTNGTTVNWYSASTGGSPLPTSPTLGYLTPSISSTTTYYVTSLNASTGCESTAARTAVTATVNAVPSAVASVTNGSRCGTGTVGLSAAYGTNGTTVNWYSASTGGSPLPTSPTLGYLTPSISSTTTYYVTSLNASTGCESTAARTAVTATINPIPNAAVQSNPTICTGSPASITITNPNNLSGTAFAWTAASANAILPATSGTGSTISGTYYNQDGVNQGAAIYTITPSTSNCTGAPITATVTINNTPAAPVPGNFIGYGNGNVTLEIAVPDGELAKWYSGTPPTLVTTSSSMSYANGGPSPVYVSLMDATTLCESPMTAVTVDFLATITPNSVTTEVVRIPGQVTEANVIGLSTTQKSVSIAFQDGLARTNQVVSLNATTTNKDLVQPVEYDSYGRTSKDYLPYSATTNSAFQNNYASAQAAFYAATGDKVANDGYPFAMANYEASPLGRVLEQGHEGQQWQLGLHSKKVAYSYNTGATSSDQDEVRQFNSDATSTGYYLANMLSKTAVTDENGNIDVVFKDGAGRVIAHKQKVNSTTWLQTYYVYDGFNRVAYIIPPAGQAALKANGTNGWALSQTIIDTFFFQFIYDNRGRMAQRKTPGQAWTYYAYDNLNRQVLTQDGNLRQQGNWSFVKYDISGRTVMTGLYTNSSLTDQNSAQTLLNGQFGSGALYYEKPGTALYGYTNQSFPNDLSAIQIWSVNYYDSYSSIVFNNGSAPAYDNTDFNNVPNVTLSLPAQASTYTKGKLTGTRKLIVGTNGWIVSAVFYDNYGRVIQTQGNNHLNLNGVDTSSVIYDFEKALYTKATHSPDGTNTTTVVQTLGYDVQGRLSTINHSINGAANQLLAQYQYNELGQVVTKQLYSADGTNFMQNVDYRYNIRGWLASINNAQLANDGGATNNDTNDYFGMELLYGNNDATGLANTPVYNGNVSAVKWKGAGDAAGTAAGQRSYVFGYDGTDRLLSAAFQKYGTTAWNQETGTLNETVSYDPNGNIQTLVRTQNTHGLQINSGVPTVTSTALTVDNLAYTYINNGNQLAKVTDASGSTAGFNDGANSATEYTYDAHGNLTADANKGISAITYNALGKAQQVTFTNGNIVAYTYDAGGNKLEMASTVNGTTTVTDYANGFVYNTANGTKALAFFPTPEGRAVKNASGSYEYQFAITDHQGNTRVLFTSAPQAPVQTLADFDGDGSDQESQFTNVPTPITYNAAATSGTKVVRLNQSVPVGPGLGKKVYPGDKVDMEVYSYYEATSGYGTANTALAALVTSVAGALVNGGPDPGGLKSSGVNSALTNFGTGANQGDGAPAAYLNYILFDQGYHVMDAGWQVVAATPFSKQPVDMPTVTVKEPGYIFVYLSYEDQSNNWVYFDDMKVTVTPTNIIQSNEYYPFGLQTANSWTRDNTTNNFLYDAGSELNSTTAMYDLPYRNYDPALGRFFQVDPLAVTSHGMTPYHYAGNNPIGANDPSGLVKFVGSEEAGEEETEPSGGAGGDGDSGWADSDPSITSGVVPGDDEGGGGGYDPYGDAAKVRGNMMSMDEYVAKYGTTYYASDLDEGSYFGVNKNGQIGIWSLSVTSANDGEGNELNTETVALSWKALTQGDPKGPGDPIPGKFWIDLYQLNKSRGEGYAMIGQAFLENGVMGDMIKGGRQKASSADFNKGMDALSDLVGTMKLSMGSNMLTDLTMSKLGAEFYGAAAASNIFNDMVVAPIILRENPDWYNENISRIYPYQFGGGGAKGDW